jgi:hypothetical protein
VVVELNLSNASSTRMAAKIDFGGASMIGQYDFNFGEVNSIWEDFRLPEQSVLDSGHANIGSSETDFTHTLLFGTKTDAFGRLAGSRTTTPLTCPSPPPRARPVLVTCCWSGCTTSGPVVSLTRPPHRPSPTVVDPDYTEAFPSAVGSGGPSVGLGDLRAHPR